MHCGRLVGSVQVDVDLTREPADLLPLGCDIDRNDFAWRGKSMAYSQLLTVPARRYLWLPIQPQ
jgi:hypothetical protein